MLTALVTSLGRTIIPLAATHSRFESSRTWRLRSSSIQKATTVLVDVVFSHYVLPGLWIYVDDFPIITTRVLLIFNSTGPGAGRAVTPEPPTVSTFEIFPIHLHCVLSGSEIALVTRCFFDIDQVTCKTHGVVGAEDFMVQRKANRIQMWQKRQTCLANYWIIQLSQK